MLCSLSKRFLSSQTKTNHAIQFILNGKLITLSEDEFNPSDSLVSFLRSDKINLKGAKRGCQEGGCGSCTVIQSKYDPVFHRISHRPINSCLTPLLNVHNSSIITIEQITESSLRKTGKLHPIQKKFEKHNASQCGFCTPGFIMSSLAMMLNNPKPKFDDFLFHLDGNLCRCTGYRSIIEALSEFVSNYDRQDQINDCLKLNTLIHNSLDLSHSKHLISLNSNHHHFYIPSHLSELIELKRLNPKFKLIVGNSELLISSKPTNSYISVNSVEELQYIRIENNLLKIGAATTIESINEYCKNYLSNTNSNLFRAFCDKISVFASNQVRSVASLIGNLMSGSSSTDFTNFLPAVGAVLKVIDVNTNETSIVDLNDFFDKNCKPKLSESDLVLEIQIPITNDYIQTYKISNRREICGSILSATIRANISENDIIKDFKIAFSKLSPSNPISLSKTAENFLKNKVFNLENIEKSFELLKNEFPYSKSVDDGLYEYRLDLAHSLLIKFYHETQKQRNKEYDESIVLSKFMNNELSVTYGSDNIGAMDSHLQVQGKAEFVDDIPIQMRTKHAAFVTSTIPHGFIKKISCDNVKNKKFELITAKDIKGKNQVGSNNEELLVSDLVTYYGQPIGIVIADTEREAIEISKQIQIDYQPLKSINSITESILTNHVYKVPHSIKRGVLDFSNKKFKVIEGEVKMGGQYHFYIEPTSSLTNISPDGNLMIYPTTRHLTDTAEQAAKVLGVDQNSINANVKRVGGAFCGKAMRSTIVSTATALCSQKVNSPVKMVLPRIIDTQLMSGDHNCGCKYKASIDLNTLKIHSIQLDVYFDCGYSYQNSQGLVVKTMLHADSAYNIENIEINGYLCQTNKISAAHFRGFGAQNGVLAMECVFERISRSIQNNRIKELNFYKNNDLTPYNVVLKHIQLDKCWTLIKAKSRFDQLQKSVRAFNLIFKYKKRGLAVTPAKYGVGVPEQKCRRGSCLIHLLKDGTILLSHSGTETGQGINTKMKSLVAQQLNVPVHIVRIVDTDTKTNSEANSTGAGYTNDLVGFAIIDACNKLKKRLYSNNLQTNKSFKEIVNDAYNNNQDLTAHGFYISDQPSFDLKNMTGRPYAYYEYGAGVALVEIDVLTGEFKVLESHIVFDAGKSLNPAIDIGQIEGGFLQGLGWMTMEEVKYDGNGKPVNTSMYKYKIPSISSSPNKFSVHLLPNSNNKLGVLSSKGVGEPPEMLANCGGFALIDAIEAARKDNRKPLLDVYDFPLLPHKIRYYITH